MGKRTQGIIDDGFECSVSSFRYPCCSIPPTVRDYGSRDERLSWKKPRRAISGDLDHSVLPISAR